MQDRASEGRASEGGASDKFASFWADYLYAHHKRSTRVCHYVGTIYGVCASVYGLVTLQVIAVLAGVVGAYCMAIGSHYIFEGRKPLVVRNPVWGAASDFRMLALALRGQLGAEFEKYYIDTE